MTQTAVGVPVQEAILLSRMEEALGSLIRPGSGRSLFLIREPEIGIGRPDLLMLVASSTGIQKFRMRGLRVPSRAAAKTLDPLHKEGHAGVSLGYERRIRRQLASEGWSRASVRSADLIFDSLAIEGKMHDWRRAVQQVARFSPLVHRAALAMPHSAVGRVDGTVLERYGAGLIQVGRERSSWLVPAAANNLSVGARLWLLELLMREFDHKENQSSRAENASNAESISLTRAL